VIGLLLDAGLPRGAAADLTADGWDVQHVTDLGLGGARGRAVVTLDHDFPHQGPLGTGET
jgi:hypothetical protein